MNNAPMPNYSTNTFQQSYMNNMSQQNQNGGLPDYLVVFARGIDGARQYPLNANKIAFIFDTDPNASTFCMRDTTGTGKPFRIFDYTEREEIDESKELSDLKAELADLKVLVAGLAKPLQELMGSPGKDDLNA